MKRDELDLAQGGAVRDVPDETAQSCASTAESQGRVGMSRIVVLGAGLGGVIMAYEMKEKLRAERIESRHCESRKDVARGKKETGSGDLPDPASTAHGNNVTARRRVRLHRPSSRQGSSC